MTRTHVWALVAVVMVGAGAGIADAQLLETRTTTVPAAAGVTFEVTNAFVRVPELRDAAAGSATIDLNVVRIRRAGGPVSDRVHVLLAGGPGDSGVNLAMSILRQGGPAVWQLFDGEFIGIDQRGTGGSRPLLQTPAVYDLPLDQPGSIENWLPKIHAVNRAAALGFRAQGIHLEAYNTRESADDVADVLRAFGRDRATLWGRSYGSHLALAVLARHPAAVERLVLVSPEGPDHTWKSPAGVDRVLAELVRLGATDLEDNLRAVLGRLRDAPVTVRTTNPASGAPETVVLGAFDIQWIVSQALGDPRLLPTIPAAVRQMASGNFASIAAVAAVRRARIGVQSAMKHMMDLSSGASGPRRRQIETEAERALLGNAINFPAMYEGEGWAPVTDLGEAFRAPVRSTVPALLLVGDLDPRTPLENAHDLAATLPNARISVVENATHEFDVFGSAAIRDVLLQFLSGQTPVGRVSLPRPVFP